MNNTLRFPGALLLFGWLALGSLLAQAQVDFAGSHLLTNGNNISVTSVAHGLHGRTYLTVQFQDSIRIGTVVRRVPPSVSNNSALLVCFDSLKHVAWTRLISPLWNSGTTVTMKTDDLGNVWLTGLCGDPSNPAPITFEGQATAAASPTSVNTWVASYSATGSLRWAFVLADSFLASGFWLATTHAGCGYVIYNRTHPPGPNPSPTYYELRILKLDANGQTLYSRQDAVVPVPPPAVSVVGNGYYVSGMTCDPRTERLYIAGLHRIALTLGGVPLSTPSYRDASLVCYDADLTPLWTHQFPVQPSAIGLLTGQVPVSVIQLQAGPQGTLFGAVSYDNRITIGTTTFINPSSSTIPYSSPASQVICFSANGQLRWHIPADYGRININSNSLDSYYIAAESNQSFTFGNYLFMPAPPATPGGAAGYNSFVGVLDSTGAPGWLRQTAFDSVTRATPQFMAVSASGELLLTGRASRDFAWGGAMWQPNRIPAANALPLDTYVLYSNAGSAPLARLQFLPQAGAPGTTVVVNGRDFQAVTAVRFNGVAATFRVNASGDQLVATVPAGARSGPITISTPQGSRTTTTGFRVTIPLATATGAAVGFAVYPNPAQTVLNVVAPKTAAITSLRLCDGLGRTIRTWAGSAVTPQLDLTGFTPGVYSLQIVSGRLIATQRVVIR